MLCFADNQWASAFKGKFLGGYREREGLPCRNRTVRSSGQYIFAQDISHLLSRP